MAKKKTKGETAVAETSAVPTALGVYEGLKLIRVYTQADHGEDYAKLAEQFAQKFEARKYTVKEYVAPPVPVAEQASTEFVTVYSSSGDVVRKFSLADHGEDYAAMAQQFVDKFPARKYTLK